MTLGVPALAAGFASQFDTIGPYVGFGSLIAVIAMAILVFSQGRELQRLREWAGTSPERLRALEDRLDQEERAAPAAAPRPAVPGVPVPGKLAPHPGAQVPAAAAAAAAAGAAHGAPPAPPVPAGAPPLAAGAAAAAAAAASGTKPPAAGAVSTANPARPVPPSAGGSQPTRAIPSVAGTPRASTPVGRANAARQREPERPKRPIGQLIGVGLVAAVVLVGVLFAFGVIGGDTESPVADDNRRDQPKSTPDAKPPAKTYSPKQTSVVVLNATGKGGLAKTGSDLLDNKRFLTGAPGDYSENGVPAFKPTSIVAYRSGYGNRDAAKDIAKHLGLRSNAVKSMDENIKAAVDGTPKIVVVLGQDYAAETGTTPADSNPTGTTPGGTTTGSSGATGTSGTTPGTTGNGSGTTTSPDSSITGDVSGDITGDVVADTTVGAP